MSASSTIPVIWSWQDFIDQAVAPDTIANGAGRHGDSGWAGASWDGAIALAIDGWALPLPRVDVAIETFRDRLSDHVSETRLVPVWDMTGSEVDVAAYLSGTPECMIDYLPGKLPSAGRAITLLIPGCYSHTVPHAEVINRGVAVAALCSAIITAARSVEVWFGYACMMRPRRPEAAPERYSAVARVISAGERLNVPRLMFATAHPAMLRRLWFGVWDSADRGIAERMPPNSYGSPPFDSTVADLPPERNEAYVVPPLVAGSPQWRSPDSALAWCIHTFEALGLIARTTGVGG